MVEYRPVQASTGLYTDGCKVGPIKLISQRPHKTITDITVSKLGISTSSLSIAIGTFKHGMRTVTPSLTHNGAQQYWAEINEKGLKIVCNTVENTNRCHDCQN